MTSIKEISTPTHGMLSAVIGLEGCAESAMDMTAKLLELALANSIGEVSIQALQKASALLEADPKELNDISMILKG